MNYALLITGFSAGCAALMVVWNIFFVPSRADRKELEKRLAKLETDDANHEARLTGFSVQMERQQDSFAERCQKIESQLSEVGQMRQDLAVVKTKLEGYGESIKEIKETMKEMFNLLRSKQ